MRKVIYSVGVSLDGYIADSNGGFEWLNRATAKAKGEDFGMRELFASIDTVLMGRKTYEVARKFGAKGAIYPGMRNYIFSRTLPPGERDGVDFVADNPAEFINELCLQPGKNMWLCGGGELAREFLMSGLVDEIRLGVVPCLVGNGLQAFPPEFAETALELTTVKQYKGGIVELRYVVVHLPASERQEGTNAINAKAKRGRPAKTSSERSSKSPRKTTTEKKREPSAGSR
jgi:dihydrofolate reductase